MFYVRVVVYFDFDFGDEFDQSFWQILFCKDFYHKWLLD